MNAERDEVVGLRKRSPAGSPRGLCRLGLLSVTGALVVELELVCPG